MTDMDRFYAPLQSDVVELPDGEAHHLRTVLRKTVGERIILFDGQGTEADARILSVDRRAVRAAVENRRQSAPRSMQIILATAVPKGERFRWLVEKATELGVQRLIPLKTERSVVDPRSGRLEKMEQTVIAACKQCGRNDLMQIDEPTDWCGLFEADWRETLIVLGDPRGGSPAKLVQDRPLPQTWLVLIGPEGGLTDSERTQASAGGAIPIRIGNDILRTETAAIALTAAISALVQASGATSVPR